MLKDTRRYLPSIGSFATFEVAARHLSFTIAAKELNVTQAAVSQHVRNLEKALEQPLFVRKHKGLELTNAGARLLIAVGTGLDCISEAIGNLESTTMDQLVTVSATTGAACYWLRTLVDRFQINHPEIRFVILASDEDDTLRNFSDVDISLICGNERCDVGEKLQYLFPEIVRPVCSPDYLKQFGPFDDLDVLETANLLHLHEKHWSSDAIGWKPLTWSNWFGVTGRDYTERPGTLSSNSYPLLIDAAVEGKGLILGWQHIVQQHIDSGTLVVANEASLRVERGNFLKINQDSRKKSQVMLFHDFILRSCEVIELW